MSNSRVFYDFSSSSPAYHEKINVLVAHPGTQHSYQTALALQNAGMLKQYVTGFYYKIPSVLDSLILWLPAKYCNKLKRMFLRRRNDDLDQSLIYAFPLLEFIYVSTARLRYIQRWSGHVLRWRNRQFDKCVAMMVNVMRPSAVICYDSCAFNTFKACKKSGSIAILDQSVGHLAFGIKILREEAVLHPEFADTLSINIPEGLVEQVTAEALAADRVLVASEYVRSTLVEIGVSASRIAIIPYGVDVNRFYPDAKRKNGLFRVLFVGGIGQRKGIKYLLEAFKQLNIPDAELVLVGGILGEGSALEPYQDIYRHIPSVPYREVHTVFQSADVFVYPSLHEGSALAIYEALACGLPVITTPNAGSVVRDGVEGFIVPIRDVNAIKEKILLLHQNKGLRYLMSVNARTRAECFTWKSYGRNLESIIKIFIKDSRQ